MSLEPRTYQQQAIDGIMAEFDAGKQRTLAVMPTGAGKTVVAAHVANRLLPRGRVMVLAHRDELIRQAVDKFSTVTDHMPAIEKGDERTDEDSMHGAPQVVVSSFQTQNSGDDKWRRMQKFFPKDFAFLWVDEAHHACADSFRRVIDYYANGNPDLKILGVTATADRSDGEKLGRVFQSVAFEYGLPDIIRDGYLVPIRQRSVTIDGLDFSKVRTTAGDLNAADLEAAMMFEKPLHGIVHAMIEVACGLPQGTLHEFKDEEDRGDRLASLMAGKAIRRSLVFTVTVAHAQRTAEIINRWIPGAAASVDGEMPIDDRRRTLKDYSRGKIHFLTNCMVASEGFDDPGVEIVVMARPTKSRALYVQQAGRGTRPLAELAPLLGSMQDADARRAAINLSIKPFVEILDFVGNSGRHKLVTAIDILGGEDIDPAVAALAQELSMDGSIDVESAIEQAEMELEEDREVKRMIAESEAARLEAEEELKLQADTARRASLVGTADYRVRDVDAFNPYAMGPTDDGGVTRGGATDKQVHFLEKLGIQRQTALKYNVRQASAVIASLKEKRCTTRQASVLRNKGYTDQAIREMNFEAAREALDEIFGQGVE